MIKINGIISFKGHRLKYYGVTASGQLEFYDLNDRELKYFNDRPNGLKYQELDF